jgi:hypothetical protein
MVMVNKIFELATALMVATELAFDIFVIKTIERFSRD